MYINTAPAILAAFLLLAFAAVIDPAYALALAIAYLIACIAYLAYWLIAGRHKHSDVPERFAKLTRWTRPYVFRLTYTRTRSRQVAIRHLRQLGKYTELDILPDGATGYVVYHGSASVGCIPHKWARFIKKYGGANNFAAFVAGIGLNDGERYAIDIYMTFDRKKRGR